MGVAATSGAVFMVIFIANSADFDHAVRVCGQNRRYSQNNGAWVRVPRVSPLCVRRIEPLFIVTFAGHHVARMAKCAHDAFPVFARGFFAARKIDDKRVAALCGDGA